jgi:hypothetical protein
MEDLTTVYVQIEKVTELDRDGNEGESSFGFSITNYIAEEYIFGYEWDEIKSMKDDNIIEIVLNTDNLHILQSISENGGFYFYDRFIKVDQV